MSPLLNKGYSTRPDMNSNKNQLRSAKVTSHVDCHVFMAQNKTDTETNGYTTRHTRSTHFPNESTVVTTARFCNRQIRSTVSYE